MENLLMFLLFLECYLLGVVCGKEYQKRKFWSEFKRGLHATDRT